MSLWNRWKNMKNKKAIITGLTMLVCVLLVLHITKILIQTKVSNNIKSSIDNRQVIIFNTIDFKTHNLKEKFFNDKQLDENINKENRLNDIHVDMKSLDIVPQCIWGTWVMTAQWHGEYGWGECYNDLKGTTICFAPTSFTCQNESSHVSGYSCG